MARNQFQSSVRETLSKMLNDPDISNSIGVAKFSKKQKGVFCKFYVKKGSIYSVFSTEISPDYITRLYQSGDINQHNLEIIQKRFGNNLRHLDIPEFIIDRHMVSEEAMENVKQDFFLDIFDNIIEWDEVNGDWISNETTDTLKIAPVALDRIFDIITNRRNFLIEVAQTFHIALEDVNRITFIQKRESGFDENTPLIFHQLISMADGQLTVDDVSTNFGLTHFRTIQALFTLWTNDNITLYSDNQEIASNLIEEELEAIEVTTDSNSVSETSVEEELESFDEELLSEKHEDTPTEQDNDRNVNVSDASPEDIDVSYEETTPIIDKNSETVKTSEDFADSTITGLTNNTVSSNEGIMSLILPNLGNEDGKLVGRTGGEGNTGRREPIVIKDARKIASEEEDNKKKLNSLKQERENLLNILAHDLDFVEEGQEELISDTHHDIEEINDEIEIIESEIEESSTSDSTDDFISVENNEPDHVEAEIDIVVNVTEDELNDYSDSLDTIEEESHIITVVDNNTEISDDADELDSTIEHSHELPTEPQEKEQSMSDQLPDLSSMIDTIYKQLNSQKEYIEETEQSITEDVHAIEELQNKLEQKKEELAKLKEDYSASIAKLQFFSK